MKALHQVFLTLTIAAAFTLPSHAQQTTGVEEDSINASIERTIINIKPKTWERDSLQAIRNDKRYAYMAQLDSIVRSREAEKLTEDKIKLPSSSSINWIRIILFVIGSIALLWLIQSIVFGKKSIFKKNKTLLNTQGEDLIEAPTPEGLAGALEKAIQQNNYRLATRYLYLLVLEHLETNGYLVQLPNKTNFHYANEIQDVGLRNEFSRLLMYYEYTWFGHFNPTASQFDHIHAQFKNILKR